jgi:hypothetical protein
MGSKWDGRLKRLFLGMHEMEAFFRGDLVVEERAFPSDVRLAGLEVRTSVNPPGLEVTLRSEEFDEVPAGGAVPTIVPNLYQSGRKLKMLRS